ncbi:V-set domain-containing T-cell activation inhibitor 1-like isoform X1 [Rhincodon typus]|uniref:V-set domain-containing T-cell activation inhibitor 1-like isoform X1 n=1 Tax=Rhincodon typus TaxID=259920 RepID=UPI00202EE72B|nr:V-set domain-containing T-cell activation inhibitor 1-like isoform X1 [Rhincodon typus]
MLLDLLSFSSNFCFFFRTRKVICWKGAHCVFLLQGHNAQKLLLLLLNVVAVSGDSPVPVSGFLGEQVVLPCTYKGNVSVSDLLVVWGRHEREIVHQFVDGNDDLREQDPLFRNRTNLFKDQLEFGNWSVLIADLNKTDPGEFQCHIYKRMAADLSLEQTDHVHLFVRASSYTWTEHTCTRSWILHWSKSWIGNWNRCHFSCLLCNWGLQSQKTRQMELC